VIERKNQKEGLKPLFFCNRIALGVVV